MQRIKYSVIWSEKAKNRITDICDYITFHGYPGRAFSFYEKLESFGESLGSLPDKYPVCKQKSLARRNMHCAVFNGTYIFVHKLVKSEVVIYNVIHGKTNPAFYSG